MTTHAKTREPTYDADSCPCDGMQMGCTSCHAVSAGDKVIVCISTHLPGFARRHGTVRKFHGGGAWVQLDEHGVTPWFWLSDLVLVVETAPWKLDGASKGAKA